MQKEWFVCVYLSDIALTYLFENEVSWDSLWYFPDLQCVALAN